MRYLNWVTLQEQLYRTFASPWADRPLDPEPDFKARCRASAIIEPPSVTPQGVEQWEQTYGSVAVQLSHAQAFLHPHGAATCAAQMSLQPVLPTGSAPRSLPEAASLAGTPAGKVCPLVCPPCMQLHGGA